MKNCFKSLRPARNRQPLPQLLISAPVKSDMSTVVYILGRIRGLSAEKRAKWRTRAGDTFLRLQAKRLVLAQWLEEVPTNAS